MTKEVDSAQILLYIFTFMLLLIGGALLIEHIQQTMFKNSTYVSVYAEFEDTSTASNLPDIDKKVFENDEADMYLGHVMALNLPQQGCGCPSCCAAG